MYVMLTFQWSFGASIILAFGVVVLTLAACDRESPSPASPSPQEAAATRSVPVPQSMAPTIPLPTKASPLETPLLSNTPTSSPAPSPTPGQSNTPLPLPTPHPDNTDWVNDRLDALVELYRPTPEGGALLRSLDLRQMMGEPGFFGSYGFGKWAGVGEARPIGIMHELGHSYWGGFPVLGRPDLAWEPSDDSGLAPAIANYHRDILTFMAQPPDEYEILRQRLRSLPNVSARNPQPLFHSLEADIPYTTGADLSLVPPILRKYWASFLAEGPFWSWEHAAAWFQSLSPEERRVAGKFLGFEHLDLREYPDLPEYSPSRDLLSAAFPVLESEERQRLTDLVEQFDTLLGDPAT